jgi:hypothetical protein
MTLTLTLDGWIYFPKFVLAHPGIGKKFSLTKTSGLKNQFMHGYRVKFHWYRKNKSLRNKYKGNCHRKAGLGRLSDAMKA